MFNDERINKETNKIFSKAILYATIISVIYLVVKLIIFGFILSSSISTIFIIITGIVILIIDYIDYLKVDNDERIINLRMEYYKKASVVFLGMSMLGFAISIPLQFLSSRETLSINDLFTTLQVLGFIYFAYQFKSKGIYFNYTFIEKEEGYYSHVFKNIFKLAILLSLVYGVALFLSVILLIGKTLIVSVLKGIFIAFIISLLDLGIIYLFISFIERLTYKSLLNGRKHLSSQVILGILIVIATAISLYLQYKIAVFDPSNFPNVAVVIARISKISKALSQFRQMLLAFLLSNILLQFKDKVKGVGLMIFIMIVSTLMSLLNSYLPYLEIMHFVDNALNIYINVMYFNFALSIVSTIGLVLLTIFLVKNSYSKFRLLLPLIMFILMLLNLQFKEFSDNGKLIFTVIQILFYVVYVLSYIKIKNSEDILLTEESF